MFAPPTPRAFPAILSILLIENIQSIHTGLCCLNGRKPRGQRSVLGPAWQSPPGALGHVSISSFLIQVFCEVFEGCAAPKLSESLGTQCCAPSGEGLVCRELSGGFWAGLGSASKLCLLCVHRLGPPALREPGGLRFSCRGDRRLGTTVGQCVVGMTSTGSELHWAWK